MQFVGKSMTRVKQQVSKWIRIYCLDCIYSSINQNKWAVVEVNENSSKDTLLCKMKACNKEKEITWLEAQGHAKGSPPDNQLAWIHCEWMKVWNDEMC